MKRIIWICLAVVLVIPACLTAGTIGPARVTLADGEVMFRTPDSDEWLPVAINAPLDEGDAVWCPEGSRTELQLPGGTMVRLDGGTQLDLLANEDGFIHLHLASGRLYLRTAQSSQQDSLQIDADDTTVLPASRTRLRLDMLGGSQEDVSIFKGSAYVEGSGGRTRVRAGEHIALEEGHSELLPLNQADSWESWNMARDRDQSRAARGESYLPDELRSYSAELDANGSWVNVPEYGMVWRPTVMVVEDWGPYRSGRWVWRGNDYAWISFESWGWVPYHYGRWSVINGFGWCWVPPVRGDVYWGPGYVGWYGTGSQVGWTPLAPGEIFYGYGNYGRHSVNIAVTTVISRPVEYRNRHVRGGMTVLPQGDFLRGRRAASPSSAHPSASIAVAVGSPRLKPLRETRMPIVRQNPPGFVPPRIEHRDSRELRQHFPRVTTGSVARRHDQQQLPGTAAPAAPSIARERRSGQPQPPVVFQPVPSSPGTPQGREPFQRTTAPATGQAETKLPRADKPRKELKQRELKPKKTWKVTTPENGSERDSKVKEHKDKVRQ